MQRLSGKRGWVGLALLGMSGTVYAHPSGWPHMDFVSGLYHPFSGLDHILAMVAIGLWAAQLGGQALWRVPVTFVLGMAIGGMAGFLALPLAGVEPGIAGSVLILGLLVAWAARLPLVASMALAGCFAVFHGYAHGAEMAGNIIEENGGGHCLAPEMWPLIRPAGHLLPVATGRRDSKRFL